MKFTEFKKSIDQKNEYSIYLFEGEDAYFRLRGLQLLKNAFINEQTLNFVSFDGELTVNELCSSLESYPFMSPKRITAVSEFYPDKSMLSAIKGYFENPLKDSILVIMNEKKSEALKKFENVTVVDCNKQDAEILIAWIRSECNKSGVTIDFEAAKMIVDFCLADMSRIDNETHKLICFVGNGGNITKEEVLQNVSQDTEYKIYELTDYIGHGKYDLALNVVNDMLSKGEPEQKLLVSIYNYYRRLLHVAISDKSCAETAALLGIKEYMAKKALQQSAMFKKRSLKKVVDLLTQVDYDVKRGVVEQNQALWLSIFKIMSEK